jgi:chemotaxis protein methyltransferase CheR
MTKINPDEFKVVTKYVYGLTGISLDEGKAYLVETRLGGLLKELGCGSYSELYYKAKADVSKSINKKIIDAITTNETLFFRDTAPFELLQHKILPDLIDKRTSKTSSMLPLNIRIWSAACSTGQELYSIAIVLKELLPDMRRYNLRLLGTDISDAAVAKASYGQFNKFEMDRGLPKDKLLKYFEPIGDKWKVKDELRAMVTFRKQNLMEPFAGMGKFDIVFCRNVAIYFAPEDKTRLFGKIVDVLEPDGFLVIGSSESLAGVSTRFEPKRYLRGVFYQLKN